MGKARHIQQQCSESGCLRIASVRGWCNACYQLLRRKGQITRISKRYAVNAQGERVTDEAARSLICAVDGCERPPTAARGMCGRHYSRFRKYGDPLKVKKKGLPPNRVTIPNESSPAKLAKILGVSRQRAHQLLNKTAHDARAAVHYALKTGRLVKPTKCERCKRRTPDLEAHHWDYHEELDVRWVCPKCHAALHPRSAEKKSAA